MPYQPADLRPEQVISPSKLKERIEKEDIFTIDVRNPSEIQEGCFISTRRHTNIPYPELENALKLSNDDFKAKYGVDKPSGTGSDLVFYCGIGIRGSLATVAAEKVGLNKCQNLDGGYKNWVANCDTNKK